MFLWRIGIYEAAFLTEILAPATGFALALVVAFALLAPVPAEHALERIDRVGGLADRAGSAYAFTTAATVSPFIDAQLLDAAAALQKFDASHVVPFRAPVESVWVVLAVACAGLATLVDLRRPPVPPPEIVQVALPRGPNEAAVEGRAEVAELLKEAEALKSSEVRAMATEIDKLWQEIDRGAIAKKDLMARVNELERRFAEARRSAMEPELRALQELAKKLMGDKVTRELAKALRDGNLEKARAELERMAKDLREKKDKKLERQLERLSKELAESEARAIGRMKAEQEKMRQQASEQEKREQRERAEGKGTKPSQQEAKKERDRKLEQLGREQESREKGAAGQMSNEMKRAGEQLGRGDREGAAKSLERAGGKLGDAERRANEEALKRRAEGALGDAKQSLKQGGARSKAMDDFKQRAAGHDHRPGKDCPECHGKKGGRGGRGQDGRQGREGERLAREGKSGPQRGEPGQGQAGQGKGGGQPASARGDGAGKPGGEGGRGDKPGKGIGTGSDFSLGEATELKSRRVDARVTGKEGRGETVSEIISGGATKGFTARGYRNVYAAYRRVAEEVIENDRRIPQGYKRLIQRYMELIRPR